MVSVQLEKGKIMANYIFTFFIMSLLAIGTVATEYFDKVKVCDYMDIWKVLGFTIWAIFIIVVNFVLLTMED